MAIFNLKITGEKMQVDMDPSTPLLWVLRDHPGLIGTKYDFGISDCGACTILLGDEAIHSCQIPVSDSGTRAVNTIEGLFEKDDHPVQKAWLEHDVSQCGYCQPGQIIKAAAFLKTNPDNLILQE